jgi:predicted component of type VI protein secretion system
MPVTLHVTNGPSTARKIYVARGQILKIGRTEWADVSFPNDGTMADVHFEIHATGPACLIRDTSDGLRTLVNGAPVSEANLHTGDAVVAGETTFSVAVEGESAPVRPADQAASAPTATSTPKSKSPPPDPVAADYCRPLQLSDSAKELLKEGMKPEEYLDLVIENELYPDAVRFLAFWLPRPKAIEWGCDCVEEALAETMTPLEKSALAAARKWSKEPNESHCRAAEKAAIDTDYSGAASWLALGAFWSGDSLAPADLPPVPPGEALTAEAITGALMLAATHGKAHQAFDRYRSFLRIGQQRLPGENKAKNTKP